MADKPHPYRFTIRDLLLATAGLGVLLYIWKSQGIYLAGSLTITLIAGGLFLSLLALRPIQTRRAPFLTCLLFNVGVLGFYFVVSVIRDLYAAPSGKPWSFGMQVVYYLEGQFEIFSLLFAIGWFIALAAFIVCYSCLLWHAIRPIPSALLLLVNLSLAVLILEELIEDQHANSQRVAMIQGYFLAIGILILPNLMRWISGLPTTREEIQAAPEEEDFPTDN